MRNERVGYSRSSSNWPMHPKTKQKNPNFRQGFFRESGGKEKEESEQRSPPRLSGSHTVGSICQRSTGRSSLFSGLCTGVSAPYAHHRLFRGRPILHSLNLRGRRLTGVVPANGCLATLRMRWSSQLIEDSSPHASFTRRENPSCRVKGNLRFDLVIEQRRWLTNALIRRRNNGLVESNDYALINVFGRKSEDRRNCNDDAVACRIA
jgi:hypothetical protein